MRVKKEELPNWLEVFSYLSKLKVDVEDTGQLVNWLDKMVEVVTKVEVEGRVSAEMYAYLLKYVLCYLLIREKSVSDRAYVLGVWHPMYLLRVMMSGLGLSGVNDVLEVMERGLRRIYEEQGRRCLRGWLG
jgi:hypothetical protein